MDNPGTLNYYSIGATDLGDIFSSTKTVGFINESDAKFTDLIDKVHDDIENNDQRGKTKRPLDIGPDLPLQPDFCLTHIYPLLL